MRHDLERLSIPDAVRQAAERFGDSLAVIDGKTRWTYAELVRQMLRGVRSALALGVKRGDRVGLCAPNSVEWIVSALAVQGAGGVVVPLSTRSKSAELSYMLRKSGATALFASPFFGADVVADLRTLDPALPALRTTVSILGPQGDADLAWPEFLGAGEALPEGTAHAAIERTGPEEISDIIVAPGPHGYPRGVISAHGQVLRAYGRLAERCAVTPADTFLVAPPFSDSLGYRAGWLTALLRGATLLPMPFFDAGQALELVAREHVTVLAGPPTLYRDLISLPSRTRYDTASLRLSLVSGPTDDSHLLQGIRSELRCDTVVSAYGLPEATGLVTTGLAADPEPVAVNAVGRALPDVDLRIIDAAGHTVSGAAVGEVQVHGYNVTHGYWDEPGATAAAITPDGWLRTGRLGALDADGRLTLVGRTDGRFTVGGFDVHPTAVEHVLTNYGPVADAAVIGVPDARLGEVCCAYVVLRPGHQPDETGLVGWARTHTANHQVPRHVRFVEELPHEADGTVARQQLRTWFEAGR